MISAFATDVANVLQALALDLGDHLDDGRSPQSCVVEARGAHIEDPLAPSSSRKFNSSASAAEPVSYQRRIPIAPSSDSFENVMVTVPSTMFRSPE